MISSSEYERLREDAGALVRSERGLVRVTGAEAAEFLQGQLTNDIEALKPGGGCYAALLNHKGKMRADLRVLRGDGWLLLDTEPHGLAPVLSTVRTYSIGRDVRGRDESGELAILSLIGPSAGRTLDDAPPPQEHSWVEGEHGMYVATAEGVDVIAPAESLERVREALGVPGVSEEAAECVRIEAGRPRHGLDIDAETIPQEAGLNERAVSFTKGCYVGQETVARLFYKGKPNRHLRGLRLSAPAASGDEIVLGERVVGRIGSTCVSPAHGPIALALVRREAEVDDVVEVGADRRPASVVELPFAPAPVRS